MENYEYDASAASMAVAASCDEEELNVLKEKTIKADMYLFEMSLLLNNKIKEAQIIADRIQKYKEN